LATFPNAGENPTIPEIGEDTIIPEIGENPIIPARGEEQQMDHKPKIIKGGSYQYADGPSFISQIFSPSQEPWATTTFYTMVTITFY
jgi:hypothetical protein